MRGSVEDFGLADILQLIAKARKSGVVTVANDEDEVSVTIKDGFIFDAQKTDRPSDAQLASRLVRAGLLTRSQLGQALKRRADTEEPMASILIELGFAMRETIELHASLQVHDILIGLFTWTSGTYDFSERPIEPKPGWFDPIDAEHLLMRGIRIADEWPLVCARIPSFSFQVEQRAALPPEPEVDEEALFQDFSAGDTNLNEIGPNERMIHELCLPGTDVQTIVDRASIDRYETCRCLSALIGEGLLRLQDPMTSSRIR